MALLLLKRSPVSISIKQAAYLIKVPWHQYSASSSSDEEDSRGAESEELNFDSKQYRSWVENALRGVRADPKEAGSDTTAASRRTGDDKENAPLSSAADGKSLRFSRSTEMDAGHTLSTEGHGPQLADRPIQTQESPEVASEDQPEALNILAMTEEERLATYKRLTVKEDEDLLQGLPQPYTGYREIASKSFRARHSDDLQISGGRKFKPGEVYDPDDLVARTRNWEEKPWVKAYKQTKKATNPVALRETDFRNVSFLHKFTSEAGNLPARRVTRLQKKVHTHVMRNIKTARTMGLLPRLGKVAELMPPFGRQK